MLRRFLSCVCSFLGVAMPAHAQVHDEWLRTFDGAPTGNDQFTATAVGPSGTIYAVGNNFDSTTNGFVAFALAYDGDGTLLWSRTFAYSLHTDSLASVVVDPTTGDVYAVGESTPAGQPENALVVKLDALGNVLWSTTYRPAGSTASAVAQEALVGSNGNLFVAGAQYPAQYGSFVAEFDPQGNRLWATSVPGCDFVTDLARDTNGNLFVSGPFAGVPPARKFGIAKLDPSGTQVWQRLVSGGWGTSYEDCLAIETDATGAVYGAGRVNDLNGAPQCALAKFDAAGNLMWTRLHHGTGVGPYYHETLRSLTFAANGNVRAAGRTANLGAGSDVFVVEYTPAGQLVWQSSWNGPSNGDDALVYFGGTHTEADGSLTIVANATRPSGTSDTAILRYSDSGVLQWANVSSLPAPLRGFVNAAATSPGGVRVVVGACTNSSTAAQDMFVQSSRDERVTFCVGDGSAAACPCGNSGATGNGCANSVFTEGGRLTGNGTASASADSVVFTAAQLTGSIALFFQGETETPPFSLDDGIGCVGGPIVRLASKTTGGGAAVYPDVGDPSVSVRGVVPAAGGTRYYQCFYRNAASAFCTIATSNRTNGVILHWVP